MKKLLPLCLFCVLVLGLTGCITPSPGPQSQFYQLQPHSMKSMEGESPREGPVVRIGPVQVSDYLDRPQMASRIGVHQIAYDELRRWAEPLKDNVQWVLARDVAGLLEGIRVVPFTGMLTLDATLEVPVRITQLERGAGREVQLQASWLVISRESPSAAQQGSLSLTQTATSDRAEDIVAAQSDLIQALGERIAKDIQATLK